MLKREGEVMLANSISEKEYDRLIRRLEHYYSTRNTLLTFSFTAVLAVLGVTLKVELDMIGSCICLLPFLLIIPFTARISYYRLASAHVNSFLRTFSKQNMQFEIGAGKVTENQIVSYRLVAWLINHEMFLLGIATSCVFYLKYIPLLQSVNIWNGMLLVIPVALNVVVFFISDATFSYTRMMIKFLKQWEEYKESIESIENESDE